MREGGEVREGGREGGEMGREGGREGGEMGSEGRREIPGPINSPHPTPVELKEYRKHTQAPENPQTKST